ncbi:MAG: membrane protein insertase YidC [Candidatus Sericytochromatia bacterium]|nr:membrane protein insertase YidC [Candidatus Sericytochromatia bacterium]
MIDFLVEHLMIPILVLFYNLTGSYGWAIICLTLVIKLALMPLTVTQFRSMMAMQKIQPRLKELQERYKGKPEELNKKVMALYSEHKVNPFGGCLPLIVQLPFLFALYSALVGAHFQKMLTAGGHPGWFFIQDLSRQGVWDKGTINWDILVMVALFGVTTWWSQKQTMSSSGPTDPVQKQMLVMMPIMITGTFIMFPIPAGVLLYIVFSNFLTVGQNMWMRRGMDTTAVTPAPPLAEPESKGSKKKP